MGFVVNVVSSCIDKSQYKQETELCGSGYENRELGPLHINYTV